jgi:hypothetical protein
LVGSVEKRLVLLVDFRESRRVSRLPLHTRPLSLDIPQVECRSMADSLDFTCRSSVLLCRPRLRSTGRLIAKRTTGDANS